MPPSGPKIERQSLPLPCPTVEAQLFPLIVQMSVSVVSIDCTNVCVKLLFSIQMGTHLCFYLIAAGMKPQIPKEVTPKVEKPPPQAKVKKTNPKAKPQKKEQKPPSTCAESTVMPEDIPPVPPPIDIPAADDNFWDFYDKPFNKPN